MKGVERTVSLSHNYRAQKRKRIKEYFERCKKEKRRCTISGLKAALEVGEERWKELCQDQYMKRDMELAIARIQDELEQRGDTMAVMLRKELGQAAKPEGGSLSVGFGEEQGDYGG